MDNRGLFFASQKYHHAYELQNSLERVSRQNHDENRSYDSHSIIHIENADCLLMARKG